MSNKKTSVGALLLLSVFMLTLAACGNTARATPGEFFTVSFASGGGGGGIVGINDQGSVKNWVALNLSLTATVSDEGRIVGFNNSSLTNNYSHSDMGGINYIVDYGFKLGCFVAVGFFCNWRVINKREKGIFSQKRCQALFLSTETFCCLASQILSQFYFLTFLPFPFMQFPIPFVLVGLF